MYSLCNNCNQIVTKKTEAEIDSISNKIKKNKELYTFFDYRMHRGVNLNDGGFSILLQDTSNNIKGILFDNFKQSYTQFLCENCSSKYNNPFILSLFYIDFLESFFNDSNTNSPVHNRYTKMNLFKNNDSLSNNLLLINQNIDYSKVLSKYYEEIGVLINPEDILERRIWGKLFCTLRSQIPINSKEDVKNMIDKIKKIIELVALMTKNNVPEDLSQFHESNFENYTQQHNLNVKYQKSIFFEDSLLSLELIFEKLPTLDSQNYLKDFYNPNLKLNLNKINHTQDSFVIYKKIGFYKLFACNIKDDYTQSSFMVMENKKHHENIETSKKHNLYIVLVTIVGSLVPIFVMILTYYLNNNFDH